MYINKRAIVAAILSERYFLPFLDSRRYNITTSYVYRCYPEEESGGDEAEEAFLSPEVYGNDRHVDRKLERARRFVPPGDSQIHFVALRRWQKRTGCQSTPEDGAEGRREKWQSEAGEGHRRVGKFPTRRKGEAGHSCYQEAVGGEEKSEEGGEEGDQKPKESGCKKPQEGGEEDREAKGSFKAEGSSKAEKDAGQSEEIERKQAEEGRTCEKGRQEGVDGVCRCAGGRPPSNGSFQSQPPHLGETRSSLGLTVFRA